MNPLQGVQVLEFGNLVAAPYCGMLLADLGAEVVKVEPPGGDLARQIGPFIGGESTFFMAVNRGKKSLVIDTKHQAAPALLGKLCAGADVIVHNLRTGAMERMGLGYGDLARRHPRIVYAAITAFGSSGPQVRRPGIDLIFQGESGMMSLAGDNGEGPHKTATTIADFTAGTNAALLVCAALAARGESGTGALVEVALRDGLIAVQAGWNALYFATGEQPTRTGTASPVTAPNQTFRTADGFLNLAVVSQAHWRLACEVLEIDANAPAFATNDLRLHNRRELAEVIEARLVTLGTAEWLARFEEAGVPAGSIYTLPEVFSDPQVLHNEMKVEYDHPRAGAVTMQGSPLRIDGAPARAPLPPPALGQHTAEILDRLDLDPASRQQLMATGAAGRVE
jgi:CoA:oxalate CoA-transferase